WLWLVLGLGSLITVTLLVIRIRITSKRVSRSVDPINQKVKGLKLELSALKRSRLERARRLEASENSEK
ncbi:MAG: hypothetical protein RIQ88_997, partial [Actinomycetota bacterium]